MPSPLSMLLDFDAFERAFDEVGEILDLAALPIIEATAEQIVIVAKQLAPVDTDALQQDIKVQGSGIDRRGPYVDVGTTEPYALYQEFGTEHNKAQPFMRPALAAVTGAAEIPTALSLAPRRRKAK